MRPLHPFARNASILDVETLGLAKESPIWEAAFLDISTNKVKRWSVKPTFRGQPLSLEETINRMEPWTRQRYESDPALRAAIQESVEHGLGAKEFLNDLFSTLRGKQVWIQNAPFESARIGELARGVLEKEELIDISKQFQTAPASRGSLGNVFYVTGRDVQSARAQAFQTGNWSAVVDSYLKTQQGKFTTVRDVQDITRSVFSQAMKLGVFSQRGTYTGSSVNVMALAMGLTAEKHRADIDVRQEAEILFNKGGVVDLESRLRNLNQGFLSAIGQLFQPENRESLTTLKRLEAVRPLLKEMAIERAFADAKLDIRRGKGVDIVTGHRAWAAPQYVHGSPWISSATISVATKLRTKQWSEAVEYLKRVHMEGSQGIDMDSMASRVNRMSTRKLEALRHTGISPEAADMLNQTLLNKMEQAGSWGIRDSLRLMGRRYTAQSSVAVLGIIGTFDFLTSFLSRDKNDRLIANGLSEMGIASELRKQNTEFGSGYQGLGTPWFFRINQERDFRAQQRQWEKQVWQEPGRLAVEQMMIEQAQKRALGRLGRLPQGLGTSYTPEQIKEIQEASGGVLFSGINPQLQKNLTVIDISPRKYKYAFDDADTLMLQKKNMLGMAYGKKISIRLAGIDAPEVAGHEEDPVAPLRIAQTQPHGLKSAEALKEIIKSQKSLTVAFDPEALTYGRHIGFLYGQDMQNINLQLVKAGMAAHLPFGESGSSIVDRQAFQSAEDRAFQSSSGMWSDPFWQGYRLAAVQAGTRITFNTMTLMDKLAKDQALQQMTFAAWDAHSQGYLDEGEFVEFGQELRSTYGKFNRKNSKRAGRKADRRDHNDIRGFQHGGIASQTRKDFGWGSPWLGQIPTKVVKELFLEGKTWQVFDKVLGRGVIGKAQLARGIHNPSEWAVVKEFERFGLSDQMVYGRAFSTDPSHLSLGLSSPQRIEKLRKNTAVIKELQHTIGNVRAALKLPNLSQINPSFEGTMHQLAVEKLGSRFVPEYYGRTGSAVVQEFAGESLEAALISGRVERPQVAEFLSRFIEKEKEAKLFHTDLHIGQLLFDRSTQQIRVSDWGSAIYRPENPVAVSRVLEHAEGIIQYFSRNTSPATRQRTRRVALRSHRQALAQTETCRQMFNSPIRHTNGGS